MSEIDKFLKWRNSGAFKQFFVYDVLNDVCKDCKRNFQLPSTQTWSPIYNLQSFKGLSVCFHLWFLCGVRNKSAFIVFKKQWRNPHFSSQKNDGIFHVSDQIKVLKAPLHKLPSLQGGSLKITLTVPFRYF